jgi:hypothetical protein
MQPAVSAKISPVLNDLLGIKYFWINSIPMPYASDINASRKKIIFNLLFAGYFLNIAQHHKKTINANKMICTHLSNHILSSQSSLGKEDPGNIKSIVEIINQRIAGMKEGLSFFKRVIFCNIKSKS